MAYIRPPLPDHVWTRQTLDIIHANVVDPICSVSTVTDNPISLREYKATPCRIRIGPVDIIDMLVSKKLAVHTRTTISDENYSDDEFDETLFDVVKNESDKTIAATAKKSFPKNLRMVHSEYKEWFSDKQMLDFVKDVDEIINSKVNETLNLENEDKECLYSLNRVRTEDLDNEDCIEIFSDDDEEEKKEQKNTLLPTKWLSESASDINGATFCPLETSSRYSCNSSLSTICPSFKTLSIESNMKAFHCQITFVMGTDIWVMPLFPDHEREILEMEEKIKKWVQYSRPLKHIELNEPCIALYEEDHTYYRAVIKDYDDKTKEVTIVYVDFLNEATVPLHYIRPISKDILAYPLRNIQARLYGVRPNKRVRENDVGRKLFECLNNAGSVYLKIAKFKNVLEVDLFGDKGDEFLIYQNMIDERYFVYPSKKD